MMEDTSVLCAVQAGEIYEHYKGKQYKIITVSYCSETLSRSVVYEALYANNVSQIWHRPYDMFCGLIDNDGKQVKRFKRVDG